MSTELHTIDLTGHSLAAHCVTARLWRHKEKAVDDFPIAEFVRNNGGVICFDIPAEALPSDPYQLDVNFEVSLKGRAE